MRGHHRQRFLRIRQRQQVVQEDTADPDPAKMFGHQRGLDAVDQRLQLSEMRLIEWLCAAQREPDAVEADRVVAANPLQHGERLTACTEEILAVDLEEAHVGFRRQDRAKMRRAKANP